MTWASWDHDGWYDDYCQPADSIVRALDLTWPIRRAVVVEGLAEHLNLDVRRMSEQSSSTLWAMLGPLTQIFEGGRTLFPNSSFVVQSATEGLSADEARRVLIDLGWSNTRIPATKVVDLDAAVRGELERLLLPRVQRALLRWERRTGVYAPEAS